MPKPSDMRYQLKTLEHGREAATLFTTTSMGDITRKIKRSPVIQGDLDNHVIRASHQAGRGSVTITARDWLDRKARLIMIGHARRIR